MSNSRYKMLCKIRALSASVAILTYLFLQASSPVAKFKDLSPANNIFDVSDTLKKHQAPIEYNPRGGEVFLAKNRFEQES